MNKITIKGVYSENKYLKNLNTFGKLYVIISVGIFFDLLFKYKQAAVVGLIPILLFYVILEFKLFYKTEIVISLSDNILKINSNEFDLNNMIIYRVNNDITVKYKHFEKKCDAIVELLLDDENMDMLNKFFKESFGYTIPYREHNQEPC